MYSIPESDTLFFMFLEKNTNKRRLDFDFMRNQEVNEPGIWEDQLNRLKEHEPAQYIVGYTEFLGLRIQVDESVLIPRPETEELTQMVLRDNLNVPLHVLDVGTGSGCIPLALKHARPNWQVQGLDISKDALVVSEKNKVDLQLDVDFVQADICHWNSQTKFDIIVSNPPYIPVEEAETLNKNVLDYEPHEALFVTNGDPLQFYKCLAGFARHYLNKPNGKLYFETHYKYAQQVAGIFKEVADVQVIEDMFGKQRFVAVYF